MKINNFEKKFKNIMKTTSFNYMKENENKNGFIEAKQWNKFFRTGKKDQWKDVLSKNQQLKINDNFKEFMNKFGYSS